MSKVSCNFSKVWLRKANIKLYLTPKVDPILNLIYKATTQISHVFRTKVQSPRRFWDGHLDVAHVFYEPFSTPERKVLFVVVFAGYLDFVKAQIEKKKMTKYLSEKNEKKRHRPLTDWQELTEHYAKSQGSSLENGVDFRILKQFMSDQKTYDTLLEGKRNSNNNFQEGGI